MKMFLMVDGVEIRQLKAKDYTDAIEEAQGVPGFTWVLDQSALENLAANCLQALGHGRTWVKAKPRRPGLVAQHNIKVGQHYKFQYRNNCYYTTPSNEYSHWHGQQCLVLKELANCGPNGETMFKVRYPGGGALYVYIDELIDIQSET